LQKYAEVIGIMPHTRLNYLEKLHKNGHRMTNQRKTILDALCQAGGHAPVNRIYYLARKLDQAIDRSTVYRSLNLFVKLGFVNLGESTDGERTFEIVQEDQHHHLICMVCNHEIDIANCLVDEFYENLQDEYDFQISMDHLIVFGVCKHCSERNNE
jgi:Fur family ferric uptake transcriptional regulator